MPVSTSSSKLQRTLNLDPLDDRWLVRESEQRNVSVNSVARDLIAFHRTSFGLPPLLLDAVKAAASAKKRTMEQYLSDTLVEHAVALLNAQATKKK